MFVCVAWVTTRDKTVNLLRKVSLCKCGFDGSRSFRQKRHLQALPWLTLLLAHLKPIEGSVWKLIIIKNGFTAAGGFRRWNRICVRLGIL